MSFPQHVKSCPNKRQIEVGGVSPPLSTQVGLREPEFPVRALSNDRSNATKLHRKFGEPAAPIEGCGESEQILRKILGFSIWGNVPQLAKALLPSLHRCMLVGRLAAFSRLHCGGSCSGSLYGDDRSAAVVSIAIDGDLLGCVSCGGGREGGDDGAGCGRGNH
jgi:hypothetical protein